ncbi:MAG TPA: hypothetical protein VNA88_13910 [Candidatus Kapabacteria bacterium]|nr:hypothetical protein [Candidatus Kapabacteria bacterium]
MLILGRILAVLSALVLGAHFLRAGSYELVALALVVTALVFVRRRWALVAVQAAMALGAVEWLSTLVSLAAMRQAMGMPYGRMAAILALVAVVCLGALIAMTARRVREYYRNDAVDRRVAAV